MGLSQANYCSGIIDVTHILVEGNVRLALNFDMKVWLSKR